MRNLDYHAPVELRTGELLIPAGRIGDTELFSAANEEDFCLNQKEKFKLRQRNRKEKDDRRTEGGEPWQATP